MITVEEAEVRYGKGEFVLGMTPSPAFLFTARTDMGVGDKVYVVKELEGIVNSNLQLAHYSSLIKSLVITFIILPSHSGKGIEWKDKKRFSRKQNELQLEFNTNIYPIFCSSNKKEALKLVAEQLVLASQKYLSQIKDFNFALFQSDLNNLMIHHQLK